MKRKLGAELPKTAILEKLFAQSRLAVQEDQAGDILLGILGVKAQLEEQLQQYYGSISL
ncbi:hypothetical protein [Algicola sagamiensis]|uniref:hypothetical protein n=1 Tax=Algicola sagamiensis TaxID=163869 RepID=UPI000382E9E8|nr:hypothetical protein [Algicola sagamiensis]